MSKLDNDSYKAHRDATPGDLITAVDTEGNEYEGTVIQTPGATLKVQSTDDTYLEFRRTQDENGDPAIALGIGGQGELTDEKVEKGLNKDGLEITKETGRISYDYEIVDFSMEPQTLHLG